MTKILIGQRFGRLKVINVSLIKKRGKKSWLCQCDCEAFTVVNTSYLTSGDTKSCGCLKSSTVNKEKGHTGFSKFKDYYKYNARKRGLYFGLSDEYLKELSQRPCFYCGAEPKNVVKAQRSQKMKLENPTLWEYGFFKCNGIDRIDPLQGYLQGNVVACCRTCNTAKLNMTQDEFYSWVKRVYQNCFIAFRGISL